MLQPYKKPELNLHAYIYQARSIRGGGGREGRLDALSVAENIFFINYEVGPSFLGTL